MLEPLMHRLRDERLVLASTSPRRRQLFEMIGLKVDIVPSRFEENLDKSSFSHPAEYVRRTSYLKTLDAADIIAAECSNTADGASTTDGSSVEGRLKIPFVIVGADTIVTMNGKIYEKPQDHDDAVSMLRTFSGHTHTVYTAITLLVPGSAFTNIMADVSQRFLFEETFHVATDVEFDHLSEQVIEGYVRSGDPMDKAGAYGIQGKGGSLIKGIHGDYYNVMGFPLNAFTKHLAELCDKYGNSRTVDTVL